MTDKPVALKFWVKLEFGDIGFFRRQENWTSGEKPQSKDENKQQT